MRHLLLLSALCFSLVTSASAQSVGLSPSQFNFGEVERGKSVNATLYLSVSSQQQNFVTRPSYSSVSPGYIKNLELESAPTYDYENASLEDWSEWVRFQQSEKVVDPSTTVSNNLRDFEGSVRFSLTVPQEAEPGWHVAKLELNPQIVRDSGVTGVGVKAVADPVILLRVPGEVEREFEVRSAQAFRIGTNEALAQLRVENTGTVSSVLRPTSFSVLTEGGFNAQTDPTQGHVLSPGEEEILSMSWQSQDLPAGNYQTQAAVGHMTGSFFVNEQVQVTDFVQENVRVQSPNDNRTGGLGEPGGDATWIIVLVLVVLGVVLYSFDIDPVWVIAISSLAGLAFLAVTGVLPIWVPLMALVLAVVVSYVL